MIHLKKKETVIETDEWEEHELVSHFIWIKISLKFVPWGPISNIPALIQIMTQYRLGNKPGAKYV